MKIQQITYVGSKQYELISVIALMLVSLIIVFILYALIQNETDKLFRTKFLQVVTQRIRKHV